MSSTSVMQASGTIVWVLHQNIVNETMEEVIVNFIPKIVKTDVTALKILQNDIVLVGIGNVANLFHLSNLYFIKNENVFCGQKIHGFAPTTTENKIAIYGGKHVKLYSYTYDIGEYNIHFTETDLYLVHPDWILTLIWCYNESKIALLTAHNIVQVWDLTLKVITLSYKCEEKCILYSGYLTELNDGILIMAGTVFSQVIVWNTKSENVLQRISGHKGVIFSISYCTKKNIIVTTSDDRSVRIWKLKNRNLFPSESEYWLSAIVDSSVVMFGHTARAMRAVIQDNVIFSIGEDAVLCTWSLNGDLLNKRRIHQDGCIWSIDADINKNIIITGGSDSAVLVNKNIIESNISQLKTLDFPDNNLVAKRLVLTARGNIVCFTEQGYLLYYDFELNEWNIKYHTAFSTSYCIMAISLCKQFIALGGIDGHIDILAETCKFDPNLKHCISQKLIDGKLLSIHWVDNRRIVVCNEQGQISLWGSQGEVCTKIYQYSLPYCKERWLTAAAFECTQQFLIAGDRCGNMHLFKENIQNPAHTLSKVHGRLGINSIQIYESKIVTTGRDGSIKYFFIEQKNNTDHYIQHSYNVKVPFEWVERFIDKSMQIVSGFRESNLMIWDTKEHRHILDINCGGGHRSWDITKKWLEVNDTMQNIIRFIYIKNASVNMLDVPFQDVTSQTIVPGFHVKEINYVESIQLHNDKKKHCIISAGEDTAIRLSMFDANTSSDSFLPVITISNHLSSIRCMYTCPLINRQDNDQESYPSEYILITAGGRAQICIWKLIFSELRINCIEIENYMLKGTDLERKKNGSWLTTQKDSEGETRFMSLNCICFTEENSDCMTTHNNHNLVLLAGCSDGFLRIFKMSYSDESINELKLIDCLKYHDKCILKVYSFDYINYKIAISMAVDGLVAFWDFTSLGHYFNNVDKTPKNYLEPFYSMKVHKAGINSFDIKHLQSDSFILATGGDDNAIHLNLLSLKMNEETNCFTLMKLSNWHGEEIHSSQVTGLKFVREFLISTSIDQRITVMKWALQSNKILQCEYVNQYHSSISDIQGMSILNVDGSQISICVFGKGIELLDIDLPISVNYE